MNHIIISIITFLIAFSFSYMGSLNGPFFWGYPTLIIVSIIGFLIHWLVFIPSFLLKTEKLYDITGTIAYLAMIIIICLSMEEFTIRSQIIITLVGIWALRLGIFLFARVLDVGEDKRFKDVKKSPSRFLMWFTISGLWVFLTTFNAFISILNNHKTISDAFFVFGLFIWLIGFLFEVIADEQKRNFRKKNINQNKFILTGLWSLSRHPNYFGEILIWVGISIMSIPTLSGWQFISFISPFFVILLLTKVSGINLLEESADKKWGNDKKYQDYKNSTPILIPFLSFLLNKKTSN